MTATTATGNGHARAVATPAPWQSIHALPATVDLFVYRGDDLILPVTVNNPDGTPADLTGMFVDADIRVTPDDTTVAGSFDWGITGNVITLDLHATTSAQLPPSAVWDLQLTAGPGGVITTIAAGRITVTPDVTRP